MFKRQMAIKRATWPLGDEEQKNLLSDRLRRGFVEHKNHAENELRSRSWAGWALKQEPPLVIRKPPCRGLVHSHGIKKTWNGLNSRPNQQALRRPRSVCPLGIASQEPISPSLQRLVGRPGGNWTMSCQKLGPSKCQLYAISICQQVWFSQAGGADALCRSARSARPQL
ncbi:hypothetical protein VTK26DRAFT_2575 [Humicola hyalothermophila]